MDASRLAEPARPSPRRDARAAEEPSSVRVLAADPDLAESLSPHARELAVRAVVAPMVSARKGLWSPPELESRALGLLVLDGLLLRKVTVGPVSSCELIGPTDIIRPHDDDSLVSLVPATVTWSVLQSMSIAVLDAPVSSLIGRWPELTAAVSARLMRRGRCLAYLMAAQHFVRAEDRLLATLWHLASMWGRVTPRGVLIPYRLTHQVLADVLGTQRPTVTMAIRSLTERGQLHTDALRRFVVTGDPAQWRAPTPPPREPRDGYPRLRVA